MIELDFIERCHEELRDQVEEAHQKEKDYINQWNHNNRELLRRCQRNYAKTEKGLYASSKRNATRRGKFKAACEDLSWEEKHLIGEFYKNCPEGYEVDHIIPVSKGGKHKLSNLQYLTMEENRRKSAKIYLNE